MATPLTLINGTAYDYQSISILINNIPLYGCISINYSEEQEHVNNYGIGSRPISRGSGVINCSGSLELSMVDSEAIRNGAPNKSIVQIAPFDITIVFGNPKNIVTHILKNVQFLSDGLEGTNGDTNLTRTFDIVPSHIEYK